jgi:hypothetical protein
MQREATQVTDTVLGGPAQDAHVCYRDLAVTSPFASNTAHPVSSSSEDGHGALAAATAGRALSA